MRILYFAWLREKAGLGAEVLVPPEDVKTPRALMAWLRERGPGHAAAFANENLLRCAVDQEFCSLDAPFGSATEIAFFPPVTGG